MRRALALLGVALTAAALTLTACGSDTPGTPGRVIAKDTDRECHSSGKGKSRRQSCSTEYELTTRNKNGDLDEFEVSSSVYDDCYRGSAYPKCANR